MKKLPEATALEQLLRDLLHQHRITQTEFGDRMGLPKSRVSELFNGKKELSISLATKLREVFNVDTGLLLQKLTLPDNEPIHTNRFLLVFDPKAQLDSLDVLSVSPINVQIDTKEYKGGRQMVAYHWCPIDIRLLVFARPETLDKKLLALPELGMFECTLHRLNPLGLSTAYYKLTGKVVGLDLGGNEYGVTKHQTYGFTFQPETCEFAEQAEPQAVA